MKILNLEKENLNKVLRMIFLQKKRKAHYLKGQRAKDCDCGGEISI